MSLTHHITTQSLSCRRRCPCELIEFDLPIRPDQSRLWWERTKTHWIKGMRERSRVSLPGFSRESIHPTGTGWLWCDDQIFSKTISHQHQFDWKEAWLVQREREREFKTDTFSQHVCLCESKGVVPVYFFVLSTGSHHTHAQLLLFLTLKLIITPTIQYIEWLALILNGENKIKREGESRKFLLCNILIEERIRKKSLS